MSSGQIIFSVVIPTYKKSVEYLEVPLKSIRKQKFSSNQYEIIISDNNGGPQIKDLAKKYGSTFLSVAGKPSRACQQVNLGIAKAKGQYILLVDHDIEVSSSFFQNVFTTIKKNPDIDAWFVPYKILSHNNLMNAVRNFEEQFYIQSLIETPRLIKKEFLDKNKVGYDEKLNSGPADWDFNIQLKILGAKFGYLNHFFMHHEEKLSFWQFISKKIIYSNGGEIYKKKWQKKSSNVYKSIVVRQYSPLYRFFTIFIEKRKWRMLIKRLDLYLMFLIIKSLMVIVYLYNLTIKPRITFVR